MNISSYSVADITHLLRTILATDVSVAGGVCVLIRVMQMHFTL